MSSLTGVRLGLCLLRCGLQPGGSVVLFCRQSHNVVDTRCKNSTQKPSYSCGISGMAGLKESKNFTVDLSELSKEMNTTNSLKNLRRFITDPDLVNNILNSLDPWELKENAPIIMECNPGPGILTRALLEAGYNVVALESNLDFIRSLKELEKTSEGKLRVVHCSFFRLDPWSEGIVKAPCMYSSDLMDQLGIGEMPWNTGVPIKVFGILQRKKESHLLWRNIYSLYQRLSVFRYGRIQLNLFMTEPMYKRLLAKPGDMKQYRALPALYTLAFDIQLLHKAHLSTFLALHNCNGPLTGKWGESSSNHLCLVRLTPRKDLFSEHFTPTDGKAFISLVKQCLIKRRSRLLDRLKYCIPGDGEELLKHLQLPESVKTGNVSPEDYKLLYEILVHSEDFSKDIFLEDLCDDVARTAY